MKSNCTIFIDYEIEGIPCKIEVTSYEFTPPYRGSFYSCYSDIDFYGEERIEYLLLDEEGNVFKEEVDSQTNDKILKYISEYMEKYYEKESL